MKVPAIILALSLGVLGILYALDLIALRHIAMYAVGVLVFEWFRRGLK